MNLPSALDIPLSGPIDGTIRPPGSKSISNRALLIAALAKGTSRLSKVLESDDTRHMIHALQAVGAGIQNQDDGLIVQGMAGRLKACEQTLYVENAGTAARFLTAALSLGQGVYRIDGNERMRQRPITDLIKALKPLGAIVIDEKGTGCPPVRIEAGGFQGGETQIAGNMSSQYISAIMQAAPLAAQDTSLHIQGSLVSKTYVQMTKQVMEDFGAKVDWEQEDRIKIIGNTGYQAKNYTIEADASSASYFFAMAAVTGGRIFVQGIKKDSSQGDLKLLDFLEQMGCKVQWSEAGVEVQGGKLRGIKANMNSSSDVAPTLAVIALFAEGETTIHDVANMRIKECDRIAALNIELSKTGAKISEFDDGLVIQPKSTYHSADFATYEDHRMAMALAVAGLKIPGIRILNPACVSKTYPNFFDDFLPLIRTL